MIRAAVVLAFPVLIALLLWLWSARRKGRHGKSFPTFLLGFTISMVISGVSSTIHGWENSTEGLGGVLLAMLAILMVGYFLGAIAYFILVEIKDALSEFASWYLKLDIGGEQPDDSDSRSSDSGTRQRAIEECAEEAYDYLVEDGSSNAADHDRAERIASGLRKAILSLGQKG